MPEKVRITEEQVLNALRKVIDPDLHRDVVSLGMIKDLKIDGSTVSFTFELTTPACPLKDQLTRAVRNAAASVPGVTKVNVKETAKVKRDTRIELKLNAPIRNVIAVSSGKGGVGKSTVSVNLALALSRWGARVGIMDADVYGPNVNIMLGVDGTPRVENKKIVPMRAYGIQVMSLGFLVPPGEAILWRGALLHSAVKQFLQDVLWEEMDYLVVDMPPGTGDTHLSLAQLIPISGGVVVTTPQNVALADSTRAVSAFKKLKVPILGIIENMSGDVFGQGGGELASQKLGVPFLGRIELDPKVRISGDTGRPIVVTDPNSKTAQTFLDLAAKIAAEISKLNLERPEPSREERLASMKLNVGPGV
jgi:ATP-binding protein involved in chromosome partitioning